MNCTCSYEDSEEMTRHAPLCAVSIAADIKADLYRHIADVIEADVEGETETFKEFWETCANKDAVKQGEELLRKLAVRLREEANGR